MLQDVPLWPKAYMTDDGVRAPMPRTDVADIPQQELLDAVRAERDAWVELVRELAEHESPSTEPDTQTPVLARMAECLTELGLEVGRVPGRESGGLLLARGGARWRRDGAGAQLVLGHSDTVWPVGTRERMPVEIVDGHLRGPGVFDMKAGLAQMVSALRALRACGRTPDVEPVLLINSDEETGSGESERHIRRLARHVCRAWVLEPALDPDGKIKTARKGVGRFTIRITGRSSHSGSGERLERTVDRARPHASGPRLPHSRPPAPSGSHCHRSLPRRTWEP